MPRKPVHRLVPSRTGILMFLGTPTSEITGSLMLAPSSIGAASAMPSKAVGHKRAAPRRCPPPLRGGTEGSSLNGAGAAAGVGQTSAPSRILNHPDDDVAKMRPPHRLFFHVLRSSRGSLGPCGLRSARKPAPWNVDHPDSSAGVGNPVRSTSTPRPGLLPSLMSKLRLSDAMGTL